MQARVPKSESPWLERDSGAPTLGSLHIAPATATEMNGRNVRLNPSRSFHITFAAARAASTFAKSTSTTLKACGLTCLLITMCSLVNLRIRENLTTASPSGGSAPAEGATLLESISTN